MKWVGRVFLDTGVGMCVVVSGSSLGSDGVNGPTLLHGVMVVVLPQSLPVYPSNQNWGGRPSSVGKRNGDSIVTSSGSPLSPGNGGDEQGTIVPVRGWWREVGYYSHLRYTTRYYSVRIVRDGPSKVTSGLSF